MRSGDRVRVTGPRGSVIATIQRLCTPAELPQLPPPAPDAGITREILEEMGVEHVAMISYRHAQQGDLVFAAIQIRGKWSDLQGRWLEIDPDIPA